MAIIITNRLGRFFLYFVVFFTFAYSLIYSSKLSEEIINSMEFSVKRLIPSLFPSMIFSSIAISNSKGKEPKKGTSISCFEKSIFRLVVCSLLSGYIIGPKMLCEDDTDEDKTRYIALTSNAGLGYVVSFVGITVCGSLFFGIFLYFTQVLSSLIIFKLQKYSVYEYKISSTKKPFIDTVSVAVKDTTHLIFEICGFYVFFSIIKTVLVSIFNIKSSTILYSFVASFLEISNGIQGASMLENTTLSAFFIGFSVGFGGICMCMQTFSVCNASLNKFKFIKIKFFQGIFCGIFTTIFIHFFNISKIQEITAATSAEFSFITVILNSIYLFCVLFSTKKLLYKKFQIKY